jgi:type I restriction enzyme S subunit
MSMPKLRFPEFRDAGEWEEKKLGEIASPVSEKSKGKDKEIALTLSAEYGIVSQGDYFGKRIAGENVDRYIKISLNDFVYNDRITKSSTYGTIKRLSQYTSGLVSPIYKCFRFKDSENPVFWEWYFESGNHEIPLQQLVNEGARAGRFNISIQKFLSIAVYSPESSEQQKIADCLSSLDDRLTLETQKLDTLKAHKKGLMQQLFPAEGETLPKLRFPEFQDSGEWEEKRLGDITEKISDGIHSTPIYNENGQYYFVNGNNLAEDKIVINESTKRVDEIEYSKYKTELSSQTILISINGTIGNLAFFNGEKVVLGKSACYINLKPNENKYFVFNLLKTSSIQKYFEKELTGSTIKNLSLSSIKNAKAFFPIPAEQEKIADCLTSIDEAIAAQSQAIDLLKLHKKGLMQQLFPSVEEVKG